MDGMIFFFFEIIYSEVNPLQEGKHKKKKRNETAKWLVV